MRKCQKCLGEYPDEVLFCNNCKCGMAKVVSEEKNEFDSVREENKSDSIKENGFSKMRQVLNITKKYPALRLICRFFKFCAWSSLTFGIFGIIYQISFGYHSDFTFMPLLFGILSFVIEYAVAEGVIVFIDIEENTRMIEKHLQANNISER